MDEAVRKAMAEAGTPKSSVEIAQCSGVKPTNIAASLDSLFSDLERGEVKHRRCGGGNVLQVVTSEERLRQSEDLIEALCSVRPSRFFRVLIAPNQREIGIKLSARCHALSGGEQSCSEIVELSLAASRFSLVPNIIRANLIGAAPTALLLTDPEISREWLVLVAAMSEEVLYDSTILEGRTDLLVELARTPTNLIDLQWIRMGPWREQIRRLADRPEVLESLPHLVEIEIRTTSSQSPMKYGSAALVLAGWIVERLGLQARAIQGDRVVCTPKSRPAISIARPLSEVSLRFSAGVMRDPPIVAGVSLRTESGVELVVERRAEGGHAVLESMIQHRSAGRSQTAFRVTRAIEVDDSAVVLERYYGIGESTTNYAVALKAALGMLGRG